MKKFILDSTLLGLLVIFLATNFISCKSDDPLPPINNTFDGTITKLYVAGSAGNTLNNPALVKTDSIFTYSGMLNVGELYFQVTKGDETNIFEQGSDSTLIELNSKVPFNISEKGYYVITINSKSMKISMRHTAMGNVLYMIGVPVDTWDGLRAANLLCTDAKPFIYTYTHYFFGGIYKFLLQPDNLKAQFCPEKGTENIMYFASQADAVEAGYDTENWTLAADGDYTVTVDMVQKKVFITPTTYYPNNVDSVFIMGGKYGWDASVGGTPFVRDVSNPKKFTLTDNMTAGEFKLPLQRHNYRPCLNKISDTQLQYYPSPTSDQDTKWNIPHDGNYTITVDLTLNSINIVEN